MPTSRTERPPTVDAVRWDMRHRHAAEQAGLDPALLDDNGRPPRTVATSQLLHSPALDDGPVAAMKVLLTLGGRPADDPVWGIARDSIGHTTAVMEVAAVPELGTDGFDPWQDLPPHLAIRFLRIGRHLDDAIDGIVREVADIQSGHPIIGPAAAEIASLFDTYETTRRRLVNGMLADPADTSVWDDPETWLPLDDFGVAADDTWPGVPPE